MKKMEEMIANLERAKQQVMIGDCPLYNIFIISCVLSSFYCQSWEEKEKLAKLYEEERGKNLGSEKKILSAMETVKEEKLAIMKKIKKLEQVLCLLIVPVKL